MTEANVFKGVRFDIPGRGRIYDSIVETIGNTPLVRAPNLALAESIKADLLLKLEFFNPLASIKDRIAIGMIADLEASGRLSSGGTLIEPTSGNTGIGLAFVGAARGYRVILTMPESMSLERRKMLALLGAEVILTPKESGMAGAIARANELLSEISGAVMPSQFDNPANPEIHDTTTAQEIWQDTQGQVDAIVAGVGTGGTFTGCARTLKPRNPDLKMIAVEPEASAVLSGERPGPHTIQGIGAGFVPENMKVELVDEVIKVPNQTAFETARSLARKDGIPVGISSGAIVAAGLNVAKRDEMRGKTVVVVVPSFAERYLSTELFSGL